MNPENLRDLLNREPFVPFVPVMASGKRFNAVHSHGTVLKSEKILAFHAGSDGLCIGSRT